MVVLQETTLIRIEMFHHRTTEAKGSVKYERMISSESSQCVVRGNQMLSPQTQLNPTLSRFHNMVCWQKTSEHHIPIYANASMSKAKPIKRHEAGHVTFTRSSFICRFVQTVIKWCLLFCLLLFHYKVCFYFLLFHVYDSVSILCDVPASSFILHFSTVFYVLSKLVSLPVQQPLI